WWRELLKKLAFTAAGHLGSVLAAKQSGW
uniref:Grammistin Gs A n=1 Tax=Grammistes sexlineatus TaxID=270576 RepID=GRAA_GRASX|nr:RecName: Full=Grammistin Gs A [Grammistes sexlineatus]